MNGRYGIPLCPALNCHIMEVSVAMRETSLDFKISIIPIAYSLLHITYFSRSLKKYFYKLLHFTIKICNSVFLDLLLLIFVDELNECTCIKCRRDFSVIIPVSEIAIWHQGSRMFFIQTIVKQKPIAL